MIYVSQIIVLYTLNLNTTVCEVYLSKMGKRKMNSNLAEHQSNVLFTDLVNVYFLFLSQEIF